MGINLISETSQPVRHRYPVVLHSKASPPVSYVDIHGGVLPGRGLLYSFLLHEIAIFALLLSPLAFRPVRHFRLEKTWRRIDTQLTYYLPTVGGGREGGGGSATKPGGAPPKPAERRAAPAKSPKGSRGLVYPAPQPVVSNPPNPTNRIQTILQPELPKPPLLKTPILLPNMVMVARSTRTPAPPPLVPKVEVKPTPVAPPEAPKLETTPQSPVIVSPIPVPPPPPDDVVPKLPVPAPPAEVAPPSPPSEQWQVAQIPQLSQFETTPLQAPNLSLPSGSGGTDERSLLVLSPTPGPPENATNVPLGEARGQFAMGPEPDLAPEPGSGIGTGTEAGAENGVPGGTGVGSDEGVAGSGEASGTGTAAGSGTGTGSGTGSGGEGTGTGGVGTGTGSGTGAGSGSGSGTGSGRGQGEGTGTGSGTGAGSGPGSGPFSGITITGGGTTRIVGPQPSAGTSKPSPRPTYGLTITATARSGGGLRDYGIFRNEAVFTVYVPMTHSATPAPAWTLQYALLRRPSANPSQINLGAKQASVRMGGQLVAPFPINKEKPEFPIEVVSRNLSRMVVVYGEIDVEGKVEKLRIIQSPNPLLNQPVLEALEKWTFRPAEMNGEPVAVKALIGIPLSLPY